MNAVNRVRVFVTLLGFLPLLYLSCWPGLEFYKHWGPFRISRSSSGPPSSLFVAVGGVRAIIQNGDGIPVPPRVKYGFGLEPRSASYREPNLRVCVSLDLE